MTFRDCLTRLHYIFLLLFMFEQLCGSRNVCDSELTDIHIIGFFPCTDLNDTRGIPVDNCDGIERIPIMRLALEEINGRCDLLPGYRLVVDYANSACSSIPALYHLTQQTDPSQLTKLMILGPACSVASVEMGEVAQRKLHISQVAYTASFSLFGKDKQRFPRFYRMIPVTEQLADVYVALVKELKWKRVAVISDDHEFHLNVLHYTTRRLTENNIHVITSVSFTDNPNIVLNQVKILKARIFIVWIPQSAAANFWCQVIKNRLAGPEFVWILPGWLRPNWWTAVDGTDCTAEEMSKALEHSISGSGNGILDNNLSRTLISRKNITQFKQDLDAKTPPGYNLKTGIFLNIGYVYDAVWTIALALNSSISILEERGLGRLEDFTYQSVEMADVFTEAIANVSFEGISGRILLQRNGNRDKPSILLRQIRDGIIVPVLVHNPLDDAAKFHNVSNQTLMWQGGSVPKDAPVPVDLTSSLPEDIIATVTSSVGILSSIFFFVFNLYYCKHPVVKRSSYRLNSLILVGVFVGFVGTLLHVIKLDSDMPETFTTTVCNARVWTNELAFVVAFGTLFAKVWRLYKVFFNKKMVKRKYLNDRHLFMMVATIVAPTLIVLIVQVATFPLTLHTVTTVNENDFSTEEVYFQCRGTHEFVFTAIAYAENIILAFLGVTLAYQTQKHVPKYGNYHKYHESAVINLTTILTILLSSGCQAVLIIFQLNSVQEGVLLVTTLRDCLWMYPMIYLLFAPKVYRIYRKQFSDAYHRRSDLLPAASYPLHSTKASSQSSIPPAAARRCSLTSVQSLDHYGQPDVGITSNHTEMSFKRRVTLSPLHEQNEESYEMIGHLPENFASTNNWLEQRSKSLETNVNQVRSDQEIVGLEYGASKNFLKLQYLGNKLQDNVSPDHKTAGKSDYLDQMTSNNDAQMVTKDVEYEACRRSRFKVTRI